MLTHTFTFLIEVDKGQPCVSIKISEIYGNDDIPWEGNDKWLTLSCYERAISLASKTLPCRFRKEQAMQLQGSKGLI